MPSFLQGYFISIVSLFFNEAYLTTMPDLQFPSFINPTQLCLKALHVPQASETTTREATITEFQLGQWTSTSLHRLYVEISDPLIVTMSWLFEFEFI